MSQEPSLEEIIARIDSVLNEEPNRQDAARPGGEAEPVEEFEFVEEDDLAAAAREAEQRDLESRHEPKRPERRRVTLTPDMQVADEQIPLLEEQDLPAESADEYEIPVISNAPALEEPSAGQDMADEGEAPDTSSVQDGAEIQSESVAEQDQHRPRPSQEELLAGLDTRALADWVCDDVMNRLHELLPLMVEASLRRAVDSNLQRPDDRKKRR